MDWVSSSSTSLEYINHIFFYCITVLCTDNIPIKFNQTYIHVTNTECITFNYQFSQGDYITLPYKCKRYNRVLSSNNKTKHSSWNFSVNNRNLKNLWTHHLLQHFCVEKIWQGLFIPNFWIFKLSNIVSALYKKIIIFLFGKLLPSVCAIKSYTPAATCFPNRGSRPTAPYPYLSNRIKFLDKKRKTMPLQVLELACPDFKIGIIRITKATSTYQEQPEIQYVLTKNSQKYSCCHISIVVQWTKLFKSQFITTRSFEPSPSNKH